MKSKLGIAGLLQMDIAVLYPGSTRIDTDRHLRTPSIPEAAVARISAIEARATVLEALRPSV
jgi:hypothetical protein